VSFIVLYTSTKWQTITKKKGDFAKHQMKNKPLSRVPGIGRTKAKLLATFEIKEVRKTGKTTDKLIAKFNIKKLASGHVDCIYEIKLTSRKCKEIFLTSICCFASFIFAISYAKQCVSISYLLAKIRMFQFFMLFLINGYLQFSTMQYFENLSGNVS